MNSKMLLFASLVLALILIGTYMLKIESPAPPSPEPKPSPTKIDSPAKIPR
jgi:hypothetical protein